jgi:hypothetical protein
MAGISHAIAALRPIAQGSRKTSAEFLAHLLFYTCSTSFEDMERFNLLKKFFVPRVLRVPCQYARIGEIPGVGRFVYACAREDVEHVEHSFFANT